MNMLMRPWTHIFDYRGRSPRREFGLFMLIFYFAVFALASAFGVIDAVTNVTNGGGAAENGLGGLLGVAVAAYGIAFFLAWLPLSIRRLHDHDMSGWFLLGALIPFLGWIFYLIMMLTAGNEHENSYGPNPRHGALGADPVEVFS